MLLFTGGLDFFHFSLPGAPSSWSRSMVEIGPSAPASCLAIPDRMSISRQCRNTFSGSAPIAGIWTVYPFGRMMPMASTTG